MSVSDVSVNSAGLTDTGTSGTSINNPSATALSSNEFLDLMMDSLENQDPLSPDSSSPTEYLTELSQMTDVEEETDTAQSTAQTVQAQSVSQAIGLIGDTVSYTDAVSGDTDTGTVQSVQITSSGATLTIDGTPGIDLSSITNVQPATATSTNSTAAAA